MRSANALPVTEADLKKFADLSDGFLTLLEWTPARQATVPPDSSSGSMRYRPSVVLDIPMTEKMSISEVAKVISKERLFLPFDFNFLMLSLRTGMELGMHVGEAYEKHSGLCDLVSANAANRLTDAEKTMFKAKNQTKAAISAFVFSSYVVSRISTYKSDEVERVKVSTDGPPEMPLINAPSTFKCLLFYFGRAMSKVETGLEALKLAKLYFTRVMSEIKLVQLDYTESFTSVTYKYEAEDFTVQGFETQETGAVTVVEFKRVEIDEIIGNHEMKRVLKRLAQFIIAYDFERQMNPLVEFDALNWLGVLQGWAGTGKSMGLSWLQTLVSDFCKALGLPFQICPIPNDLISSLQGESAKKYLIWWMQMSNPRFICVAPVDDAEAVYLDRRLQSSSEGSKLAVMSHLRLTEGSTAVYKGNFLQPHASNNVDMIDPPVFSRYQFRVLVPGAETREDFSDQTMLWANRFNKRIGRQLIKLEFPGDYQFLSNQGLMSKMEREQKAEAFTNFKDKELARLWDQWIEQKKLAHMDSCDMYGTFFSALHNRYEQFTSRDVRNITMNASSRLFGFDFDSSWLEKRDVFVGKDYDTKKQMILDAALQYQNGLTVDQVLFQEMVHYVESTISMLDSGRQFRIRQQANDMVERKQAMVIADKEWAERQPETKAA